MSETPAVVVVSGHMIDAPNRKERKAPAQARWNGSPANSSRSSTRGVGAGTTICAVGLEEPTYARRRAEAGLRRGAECLRVPGAASGRLRGRLCGPARHRLGGPVPERARAAEVEINAGADDATTDGADVFARANARLVELANSRADRPHAALVWDGGRGDGGRGEPRPSPATGFRRPEPRACVIDPTPRDYEERQSSPGPKRMLALDGGGIRGVLTLEILRAIESHLRARRGDPNLMLSDYFDYIGDQHRSDHRGGPGHGQAGQRGPRAV